MAFTQIAPMNNRSTGFSATLTRPWLNGVRTVDIRADVWGANGFADPWAGIAQPFNDPAKQVKMTLSVQYADSRIEEKNSATWSGKLNGNWGCSRPGCVPEQPTIRIDFPPGLELPVQAMLKIDILAGPITAGLSVQL